ncbi:stage III sporulation protein AF [Heyndrickxia ginsengihumi]|uniref:Stage III sporulation protein AF n=1 Tax=Heyndrickxia ginsengihumi TaxID=363870 RepID=A0A0A6VH81_9BACI|nr:stage III sporulation protein AF [Heyndrickxia ginsengihumi]KHD85984.1 stage III sporulation protein AF [Heyndrickxia ginsengihumi]MBE6182971.1 stage III sporulation protein AF [Bacillus sp. (in: firmicutes)]MCM3022806.1 stage III sporulation protein AF [Heyndrickxia ginsengihumi]NEY20073.1 stage III sporulation protein AF [Heyndrickxia ginsengihumi]
MEYITKWVLNIIIFILLAMVVDMLLPDSSMRKYTKLVIGLLLVTIIVTPIFQLFSKNFNTVMTNVVNHGDVNQTSLENSIEIKKKEIISNQQEYTLKQMAVQMKKDAEGEVEKKFGKQITDIQLTLKNDNTLGENGAESIDANDLKKIIVYVKQDNATGAIASIEPVNISATEHAKNNNSVDTKSIISTLSNHWNVSKQKIELHIEGGTESSQ